MSDYATAAVGFAGGVDGADERHARGLVGLADERRESHCGSGGGGGGWRDVTAVVAAAAWGCDGGATSYCPAACRGWPVERLTCNLFK